VVPSVFVANGVVISGDDDVYPFPVLGAYATN